MRIYLRVVFCWLVAGVFFGFAAYLDGVAGIPEAFASYGSLFLFFAVFPLALRLAWAIITGKMPKNFWRFLGHVAVWYHVVLAFLFASCVLVLGYFNAWHPAQLPVVTLSNGERTVVFRTMAHVATPDFYRRVQADVKTAGQKGEVVFYEGVLPGKPGSLERFQKLLGLKFDADTYAILAKAAGLADQLSYPLASAGTGVIRNVDVSVDDILAEYDRLAGTGVQSPSQTGAVVEDPTASLVELLGSMPAHQKSVLAYLARAFLNAMIEQESDTSSSTFFPGDPFLAQAIVGLRDQKIADAILSAKDKNIYAVYGLLHFHGVYEALQKADPNWTIVNVANDYPARP